MSIATIIRYYNNTYFLELECIATENSKGLKEKNPWSGRSY
jgi:hypothetical protein